MFQRRALEGELAAVRDAHAPDAIVFDCRDDFGTLPPAVAESLLAVVDGVDPIDYDPAWVPDDAPGALHRLASDRFTVGAAGHGGVTWTRQTDPATVFVKPRLSGSPDGFVSFLIAEALVAVGTGVPETSLAFLRADYPVLDAAVPLGPTDTYQVAVALWTAYTGLHTRPVFQDWADELPELHAEWVDAGERLDPRLRGLSEAVASSETAFPEAAELACSAVKHGLELPTPFSALDTDAYRTHGSAFAVRWAEKVFDALD